MRTAIAVMIASVVSVSSAAAQVIGFPSFNAPYRAFSDHEAGFAVLFPGLDDAAVEGFYRFGRGEFDIGVRGGIWFINNPSTNDEIVAFGVEARRRILTHSDDFPADGVPNGSVRTPPASSRIPRATARRRVATSHSRITVT